MTNAFELRGKVLKLLAGQPLAVLATHGSARSYAEEVPPEERSRFLKLYMERHPSLLDFVDSPTCALFRVRVDTYYIVTRFQEVAELHLAP